MKKSVFDDDVKVHDDIETQFDTADVVFALMKIRQELQVTNAALAIVAGIGIATLYWASKK